MIEPPPACCAPPRDGNGPAPSIPADAARRVAPDAVQIPGGKTLVGTRAEMIPNDGEGPQRQVRVKPFLMAATTVTNAQFASFVEATGYRTEAEQFGWSFVFWSQVPPHIGPTRAVDAAQWWRRVDGADWRNINGPGTDEAWQADHPAVHLSWNDARAYAAWVGGRLPTEAEWEWAARGGLGDVTFPWGERAPNDIEFQPCNIWQGRFPEVNTARDGYATTAPAQSFAPNGHGLYNMAGNVWEWTDDLFRIRSLKREVKARLAAMKGYRLLKGGSFLCHASYCYRYRIAARIGNSPDSTTTHQGLRVVWDV